MDHPLSGGGLWIPNNHVSKNAGLQDSEEDALTYMENVIDYDGKASSKERKTAYINNGSEMVKYLEDLGMGSLYRTIIRSALAEKLVDQLRAPSMMHVN